MSAYAVGINDQFFRQNSPHASTLQRDGITDWSQDIPRKAPHRLGTLIDITSIDNAFQQNQHAVSDEIDDLRKGYLFSSEAVGHFLEDHRAIRTVLRQAIDPLKATFGADNIFNLEVSTEEDGSSTLYAIAIWRAEAPSASCALHNFLENWWLYRMNAATSDLAFTYKLV